MTTAKRIRISRYLNKIEDNKKMAKDVGVKNVSTLHGKRIK